MTRDKVIINGKESLQSLHGLERTFLDDHAMAVLQARSNFDISIGVEHVVQHLVEQGSCPLAARLVDHQLLRHEIKLPKRTCRLAFLHEVRLQKECGIVHQLKPNAPIRTQNCIVDENSFASLERDIHGYRNPSRTT